MIEPILPHAFGGRARCMETGETLPLQREHILSTMKLRYVKLTLINKQTRTALCVAFRQTLRML